MKTNINERLYSLERLKVCKELGAEVKDFEKSFKDFFKMISYLNL